MGEFETGIEPSDQKTIYQPPNEQEIIEESTVWNAEVDKFPDQYSLKGVKEVEDYYKDLLKRRNELNLQLQQIPNLADSSEADKISAELLELDEKIKDTEPQLADHYRHLDKMRKDAERQSRNIRHFQYNREPKEPLN